MAVENREQRTIAVKIGDGEFAMLDALFIEASADDKFGSGHIYRELRERLSGAWASAAPDER